MPALSRRAGLTSGRNPLSVPRKGGDDTVLRISLVEEPYGAVTLRLEGQVRGPWVEALRQSCESLLARGSGLILDLTEVSFIDLDGVALCRCLRARKVSFLHCSPFVAEQLKELGL
jgi:anti-anti-sigma regulatory factor